MSMPCTGVCQGWIKHATLINNCYPTDSEATLPKSSELSYLLFYAKSKPAKLTKCGVYLEKRVVTDIRKKRKQDTEVSLQIIKSLLEACKKDLNLFSKNVVKIIASSLSTNDIDLIARAASVFITFCADHDGSTIGVDTEFTTIYESLIYQFAKCATYKHEADQSLERRYRSIGLYALRGVVTSSALHATDTKTQLQYIVPAILHNLTDNLEALQKIDDKPVEEKYAAPQSRRFSTDIKTAVSIEDNTHLAYGCLKQLLIVSNASNLQYFLNPAFKFLEDNNIWWPNPFSISLALVILSTIQRQYRHILVSEIIRRLDSLTDGSSLSKKITFIEMLISVLTSDLTVVGLLVLEVLDSLLNHLLNSLKCGDIKFEQISVNLNSEGNNIMTEKTKNSETMIVQRLITCIGGLATHIYYAKQIGDIVESITQRLNLQNDPESKQDSNDSSIAEEIPPNILRKMLLKCLSTVIQTNKEAEKRSPEMPRVKVPVEAFHNTIGLCMDEDLDVRITYAQILSTFLDNGDSTKESKKIDSVQITYFNQPAIHFLNTLHLSLYQYALLENSKPADNVALLLILRSLLLRFGADQIIRGIPVVFKLQSEAEDEKLNSKARQRALASVIVLYFYDIAQVLGIPELQQYVEMIQKERIEKHQWSIYVNAIPSENNLDNIDLSASFEDENNQPLQSVDIWLDRQTIVHMLCKHKEILNFNDVELEEKLMAEWKPEEGFERVKKEASRIRSSRIIEADKPKLVVTSIMMNLENSSDDLPPKVKTDNFKETLAVQLMNDSSEHETSVASDRESGNMVPIGNSKKNKRKNKPKNEASAFLSAIDPKAASTTSLVNPPYRLP